MGAILSLLGLGQPQQQTATNKVVEYGKNLEKRVAKKQKKNVEETKKAVIEADKEAVTKKKTIDDDVKLDEIVKDSMKKEVDTETVVKKKMIVSNAKVTEEALKAERVKNAAKKAELEEKIKLLQAQRDEAIKKRRASETREKEAIKAAQVARAARKEQEKTLNKTTNFLKTVKAEERDAKKRMQDLRTKCSRYEEQRTDICQTYSFCNNPMNAIDSKREFRDRCRPLFRKLNLPKSMLEGFERRIRKLVKKFKKNRREIGVRAPPVKLTRKDKFILRKCARIPRDGSPPWRERRDRNEKRCKRLEKKRARISKKAIGSAIGFVEKSKMSLNARENKTLRNCKRSKHYRRMRSGECHIIRNKARALKIPTW